MSQSYIVKVRANTRLSGEYDGGKTLASARKEARQMLYDPRMPDWAEIWIALPTRDGLGLRLVEEVRRPHSKKPTRWKPEIRIAARRKAAADAMNRSPIARTFFQSLLGLVSGSGVPK